MKWFLVLRVFFPAVDGEPPEIRERAMLVPSLQACVNAIAESEDEMGQRFIESGLFADGYSWTATCEERPVGN